VLCLLLYPLLLAASINHGLNRSTPPPPQSNAGRLGEGFFQGLPISLNGVQKVLDFMDWQDGEVTKQMKTDD
jgi:hypothetical protein